MKMLYKTTIVIWRQGPFLGELTDLAYEATEGDAYCSRMEEEVVVDPTLDPDFDDTDFFIMEDD